MRDVKPQDLEPGSGSTEADGPKGGRPQGDRPDDGIPGDGSPEDRSPEDGSPEDGSGGRRRRRGMREQSATQRALGLLTRREHSRKELQRKLTSRGMDAGEVETVSFSSVCKWKFSNRSGTSLTGR